MSIRRIITRMLEVARENDYYLYHVTEPHKALSILSSGSLRLPLAKTNESEAQVASKRKGKNYYMSFARSPTSGYIADRAPGLNKVSDSILFVFDKQVLAKQRNVIFEQVQYFGAVDSSGRQGGNAREKEERLFSSEPVVKSVSNSIVEIRIYVGKGREHHLIRKVLSVAKKRNMNVKLFSDANYQGYLLGKENAADRKVVFDLLLAQKDDSQPRSAITESYSSRGYYKHAGTKMLDEYRHRLYAYVYKQKYEELTAKQRSEIYHLTWDSRAFYEGFKHDLHNLRGGRLAEQDAFNKALKFMKAKNVDDFFAKLYAKWKKLRDAYNVANK